MAWFKREQPSNVRWIRSPDKADAPPGWVDISHDSDCTPQLVQLSMIQMVHEVGDEVLLELLRGRTSSRVPIKDLMARIAAAQAAQATSPAEPEVKT